MNDNPDRFGRFWLPLSIVVFVGGPIIVGFGAGYLATRRYGANTGVGTFFIVTIVLLLAGLCVLPWLAARAKAPGWPAFRTMFGDHPLWWLGRRSWRDGGDGR